jgi:hypothetical protein
VGEQKLSRMQKKHMTLVFYETQTQAIKPIGVEKFQIALIELKM